MNKKWKKIIGSVLFVSVATTFVLSSTKILANEFEGNEDYWNNVCFTQVSDENIKAQCNKYADYLRQKSNDKRNQAADAQTQINEMQGDINALAQLSYQYSNDLAAINAEVDGINAQIAATDATLADLETKIVAQEAEVEAKTNVVLARMVELQVSINTNEYINFIMGSEDLMSFLQRTQSIGTFTDYDNDMIQQLNDAVASLENDKQEQVRIKDLQEAQKTVLVNKQAEAQAVADANNAVYTSLSTQSAQLANARDMLTAEAAEAEEIVRSMPSVSSGGGGSTANADFYGPWYSAPGNIFSPTYTGQCTWYVYGRANEQNGGIYAGRIPTGNANSWLATAQARGFATGNTPRANSIIVWGYGYFGHVAYVESYDGVNIRISEGNVNAPGGGLPIYTSLETAIQYTLDKTWNYSALVASRAGSLGYPLGFIYL